VPPPFSDEAISSWIARVAARYDASPYDLARVALPKGAGHAEMYRLIDSRVGTALEAALSRATGLPAADFAVRRLAGLTAQPKNGMATPHAGLVPALRQPGCRRIRRGPRTSRVGVRRLPDLPETQPAVAHHLPAVPPAIDVSAGGWQAAAMVFALLLVRGRHA